MFLQYGTTMFADHHGFDSLLLFTLSTNHNLQILVRSKVFFLNKQEKNLNYIREILTSRTSMAIISCDFKKFKYNILKF